MMAVDEVLRQTTDCRSLSRDLAVQVGSQRISTSKVCVDALLPRPIGLERSTEEEC